MEAIHNEHSPDNTKPERHSKNIPATLVLISAFFPASAAELRAESIEPPDGRAVATSKVDHPPVAAADVRAAQPAAVFPAGWLQARHNPFAGLTELNQEQVIGAVPPVVAPIPVAKQAAPEKAVEQEKPAPVARGAAEIAPALPAKGVQPPAAQGEKPAPNLAGDLKDFGDTLYDWLKRGMLAGLGIAGAIAAIRGTLKVVEHFKERWDARRQFEKGQWFDRLTCHVVAVADEGGKQHMEVLAFASPQLADFITNKYAQNLFIEAAKKCTDDQPFPTLNFDRDRDGRLSGLNRINKYFRESFSSIYQDDIVAAGMGLPTMRGTFFLLPTCELIHKGSKPGRCIGVIAISDATFNKFGVAEEVEKMIADNPAMKDRIERLRDAYFEHKAYAGKYPADGELFPQVTVVIQK